eukprot:scaffold257847_cov36-Prasinocladus_malaysianus.AAC.1
MGENCLCARQQHKPKAWRILPSSRSEVCRGLCRLRTTTAARCARLLQMLLCQGDKRFVLQRRASRSLGAVDAGV